MNTHCIARLLAVASLAFAFVAPVEAEQVTAKPGADLNSAKPRQGWFWYLDPKKEEPKPPAPVKVPAKEEEKPAAPAQPIVVVAPSTAKAFKDLSEKEREQLCGKKDTWQGECGFIDPGSDFEFQAKQRDVLLQFMSLTPDKPEAVEAAQKYMKWVVGKASMAANMWYFNMTQNPDLDPRVKNPISEVGIALATKVTEASQFAYFELIREEGGVLFFFSRHDCAYCYDQAPYARRVANTMGLQLINIPLDGQCLPGFEGDDCGNNIKPEQLATLDVRTVPTMYLYVPANTWLRLGTGVVSDQTIMANTVNFFSAYRAAMLHGLDNGAGARPSVTFDPQYRGAPSGSAAADGASPAGAPTQTRMMELLGYGEAGQPTN